MPKVTVEIEEGSFDELIVNDLKTQYKGNKDLPDYNKDKKLLKAFKRVIEYYGGSVDNG